MRLKHIDHLLHIHDRLQVGGIASVLNGAREGEAVAFRRIVNAGIELVVHVNPVPKIKKTKSGIVDTIFFVRICPDIDRVIVP